MGVEITGRAGTSGYEPEPADAADAADGAAAAESCSAAAPATQADVPAAAEGPAPAPASTSREQVSQLIGELLRSTLDAALPAGGGPAGPEALAALLAAAVKLFKAIQRDPAAANEALRSAVFDHQELCQSLRGFAGQLGQNPTQAILGGLGTLAQATSGGGDLGGLGDRLAGLCPQPRLSGDTAGQWGRQGSVGGSTNILGADLSGGLEGRVGATGTARGDATLGRNGLTMRGETTGSLGAYGAAHGSVDTGLGSVGGRIQGGAGLRGGASGEATVGPDGIQAHGAAQARLGVEGSVDGQLRSALLDANAKIAADASVYAEADGQASVDANGIQAKGRAEVGVRAQVEVDADFRTAGTTIGGERLDLNGQVHAVAEASARASVDADVAATLRPPRVLAELGAEAFVGVKAGVDGSIGIGDFLTLSGSAEAWAGAGAEAGIVAGYDDGKLRFGFNFGAALEVGAGCSFGIEIDVKSIGNALFGVGADILGLDVDLDDVPGLAMLFADYDAGSDQAAAEAARRSLEDIQRSVLDAAHAARQQEAAAPAPSAAR